jgi:UDP:flavonoid glycosyltransferase YjiC (YdhE family)
LLVLTNASKICADSKIEALLVDQADLASGSVAERLDIPFISVSMFPPVFLDDDCPPFLFSWLPRLDEHGRRRNRRGNEFFCNKLSPITSDVNGAREKWKLPELTSLNHFFSGKGIVTQVPEILDFPPVNPASLPIHHTGPFYDGIGRPTLHFPWERLNGKPLIYASMGTVRCSSKLVFETIAAASSSFDCQLVLTLGGTELMPEEIRHLPKDAIAVHFAPQTELIRKARLCICHGGINTVLDSVANGVPLVILPVADDQPGVAARIAWVGAGVFLPVRRLTVQKLRGLLESVLLSSTYLDCARSLREQIAIIDGLGRACDVVESQLA